MSVVVLAAPMFFGAVTAMKNEASLNDVAVETYAPAYNIYFGDLHTHTIYSDAWEGTPWDAYAMAIEGGADFMATTDHFSFWHAYEEHCVDAEEWADTLEAAAHFTSETFVAMPAYEYLIAARGEINVYNVKELPPVGVPHYVYDRLDTFYTWLSSQPGAIGQWNHPQLYYCTDFMDYESYTPQYDEYMNVIEAYNYEIYEDSYVKALDAGWHVMPAANSDTHDPNWIVGGEMRSVLLATVLDADHLYDAMRNNRGYGTLDKNLEIMYTLDGAIMGSNLTDVGSVCSANIHIYDEDGAGDAITKVEIISNGGVPIVTLDLTDDPESEVDWQVDIVPESGSYYFVRVTTLSPLGGDEAGVTAWTAPVWIA
jgi:hypothetical protein